MYQHETESRQPLNARPAGFHLLILFRPLFPIFCPSSSNPPTQSLFNRRSNSLNRPAAGRTYIYSLLGLLGRLFYLDQIYCWPVSRCCVARSAGQHVAPFVADIRYRLDAGFLFCFFLFLPSQENKNSTMVREKPGQNRVLAIQSPWEETYFYL